ncbi:hypothetical protein LIER_26441 [Lithospermum erythrorhizon]|uniref:J domain-containing protein n=1 Tax=Lithospermum erythrorhizon TaxID=34254 RepID=A0AAV3R9V0_LITER
MQGALSFSAGTRVKFSPETSRFVRKGVISAAFVEAPPMERRRAAATLYEVLRVKQDASNMEIKAAYRTLAKLYHPDVSAAMEGREFMEVKEAYETLSDGDARREYDLKMRSRSRMPVPGNEEGCVSEFYTGRRWETDQCW